MNPKVLAGLVGTLFIVLLIAMFMVKMAIWRTAFALGGSMVMFGLVALLIAAAVVMFSLRSRRARY